MTSRTVALMALLCPLVSQAAVTVSGPTSAWTAVLYGSGVATDPNADHQTGILDADIVGNATHPSFYVGFDNGGTPSVLTDGSIAFRLRVAGDKNPSGFESAFWVGIDANGDGKLDLFAGAIEGSKVGFYPAGNSANISPSTTSLNASSPYYETVASAANYSFVAVSNTTDPSATNYNLDGGSGGSANHTDHFVSFMLPFNQLVTAINTLGLGGAGGFDETKGLRYVSATSNNQNSLNQDLNGISGSTSSSTTWTDLGGFTKEYSATGSPIVANQVPEPGSALLLALGGLLISRRKRG